jgi:Domain of unknown function (DUF4402)
MTMILSARRQAAAVVAGLAMLCLAGPAVGACDKTTDGPISLTIDNNVALGTLTRPDNGQPDASVTVAPDGTRTIPGNLIISNASGNPLVSQPRAAKATITGGPGCQFEITVILPGIGVPRASMAPLAGYAFVSQSGSTSQGVIDGTGRFKVTIGAEATVSLGNDPVIMGSFDVTVRYF